MIEKSRREPPLPATDSTPKPGNFPIGSPESRAAARLTLEYVGDNRPRMQFVSHIPRPGKDNTQPHATPWHECANGTLFRVLYVPPGMDKAEARRIVDVGGPA